MGLCYVSVPDSVNAIIIDAVTIQQIEHKTVHHYNIIYL